MHLELTEWLLWGAGFFLNLALFVVLWVRRRFREAPIFTVWIGFSIIRTAVLFTLFSQHLYGAYKAIYWTGFWLDHVLQIGVVVEIAWQTLRRNGRWAGSSAKHFKTAAVFIPICTAMLTYAANPAAQTLSDAVYARANLATTLVVATLFFVVLRASANNGLSWTSLTLREGYGFVGWVIVAFITDTLHVYWRTMAHFDALERVRNFAFLGTLIYWIVIMAVTR